MGSRFPVPEKEVQSGKTDRLLYALCAMQGKRRRMEDRHTLVPEFTQQQQQQKQQTDMFAAAFFAIFDGHGGSEISELLSQRLSDRILRQAAAVTEKASEGGRICSSRQCLSNSKWETVFLSLDEELRAEERKRKRFGGEQSLGGSTAITLHMQRTVEDDGWELTCANVGDSRAILCHQGKVVLPLSRDHKPSDPEERQRIEKAGGRVAAGRVDGDLALSRAFGDFAFKDESRQPRETKIIAVPEIVRYAMKDAEVFQSPYSSFIVMACDGIWDVFGNEELERTIRAHFAEIGLFDQDTPVADRFLQSARRMWNDKLVEDWDDEDLAAWIEANNLAQKGQWLLDEFFRSARTEGEFSERIFESVVPEECRRDAKEMHKVSEVKQILMERIALQRDVVENPPAPPTTPEGKLALVAKKIVDEAVFERHSTDNISLIIVFFRHDANMVTGG